MKQEGRIRYYDVECQKCKHVQEVKVLRTEVGWYFSCMCSNCNARINQNNVRLVAV